MVPGRYELQISSLRQPWHLLSARAGEQDILDQGLTIVGAQPMPEIVVTLTSRPTVLAGTVADAAGNPTYDASVVAFPRAVLDGPVGLRRIAVAQPDIDGRFEIVNLPPDEYLVAATAIDWDPWVEPERLAALAPMAERITLRLGDPVTASLVRR